MSALTATTAETGSPSATVLQNSDGLELSATLLNMSRFQASFEVYCPPGVLRVSEVLRQLRICVHGHMLFSGRAVITALMHLGSVAICEAALDEGGFNIADPGMAETIEALPARFTEFLQDCGTQFRIHPEFKVVMADMRVFFMDLHLWMEQMELFVRSSPSNRQELELQILHALEAPVLPAAAPLLEKFEALANQVGSERQAAHRAYMKRQIHPVVLCSPFLYRTYQKPLGYAGDYEMVNMMLRDPFEGASMFAKIVNRIFLNTPPVLAHQDRIAYLTRHLQAEAARHWHTSRPFRVFDVGCGPAREVQQFIAESPLADRAEFTLLDFNQETLSYTEGVLREIAGRTCRNTSIEVIKKSVHQMLKESGKASTGPRYDLVYCAGLFDYLSDAACKRLVSLLYELLAPGGLLLCTNVNSLNPSRNWMEYVLDWFLIYRNPQQFSALIPERVPAGAAAISAIGAGVNIGLEIRKPADAN